MHFNLNFQICYTAHQRIIIINSSIKKRNGGILSIWDRQFTANWINHIHISLLILESNFGWIARLSAFFIFMENSKTKANVHRNNKNQLSEQWASGVSSCKIIVYYSRLKLNPIPVYSLSMQSNQWANDNNIRSKLTKPVGCNKSKSD